MKIQKLTQEILKPWSFSSGVPIHSPVDHLDRAACELCGVWLVLVALDHPEEQQVLALRLDVRAMANALQEGLVS